MIHMEIETHSSLLGLPNKVSVVLPDKAAAGIKCSSLLCLHDIKQNREQFTAVWHLADKLGVALIIPDGRRSLFVNMVHGPCWNDYLSDSLMTQIERTLPVINSRMVFAAGYGAFGAGELSAKGWTAGAFNPANTADRSYNSHDFPKYKEWEGIFGYGDEENKPDIIQPETCNGENLEQSVIDFYRRHSVEGKK